MARLDDILLPAQATPFVDRDGRVRPEWLRALQNLTDAINGLRDNSAIIGSAGSNAALESLLTDLAAKGVIDDQST